MNVLDMLKYGDQTLMGAVKDLPEADWEIAEALGYWSVKNIIAHMTSYEIFLEQVLNTFLGADSIPLLEEMKQYGDGFNDEQVNRRQGYRVEEQLEEYHQAHGRVMELAAQIPAETFPQNGTIPWYGEDYCLDDFIVYTIYAHKREHSGHIDVFRDRLAN
jgi:hypothetical protein